MTDSAADSILATLAERFAALGSPLADEVVFVDDEAIDYENGSPIPARSLVPAARVDDWLGWFAPGASWVHCTLVGTRVAASVVSVRRGRPASKPGHDTPINVAATTPIRWPDGG